MSADPEAVGLSTIEYCAALSKQRHTTEAKGRILRLPRTGLVVVPFQMHRGGGWDVVVVVGNDTYAVGGYNLSVGPGEIETAIELEASVWRVK